MYAPPQWDSEWDSEWDREWRELVRIATVEQSREIDRRAQEDYGLTAELLMEAAGCSAMAEIRQNFVPELRRGPVAIVCGPGNNGADGLVVARHLHSAGQRELYVFLVAPSSRRTDLFRRQLERVERQGLRIIDLLPETASNTTPSATEIGQLQSCALIVDALFGIGLRSKIEKPFSLVIERMNAARAPIVSLDTPSGLDCDSGTIGSVAVRAEMTCTFGLAKPGFFVNDGPSCVGRLRVLSIGFPAALCRAVADDHFTFGARNARTALPRRKSTSNKSDHGRLIVFAGRPGMWGAGLLAATSAYRMGAGYVVLAGYEEPVDVLRSMPEVLTAKIGASDFWKPEAWDAVVIGPGFGAGEQTIELLRWLRESGVERVVVDADAITACVEARLFPLPSSWVLTPHAGELARVLGVDAKTIEGDRFRYAAHASARTGCHVLLKGFRSVLAHGRRRSVILSGNSALAKAGTGDVLSGMIGALLAQGVETGPATAAAAYIHGRMADEWVRSGNDRRSLTASDLREHLPTLMARLTRGLQA